MPNPGPRARALHIAIKGRIPALTIQARVEADLVPPVDATEPELQIWVEVKQEYSAKGPKRGGDDGHAYQLARAGVYCGRLRTILLTTGEQRRSWIRQVDTPDEAVASAFASTSPVKPWSDRLVEGFAANPDLERDVPLCEGVKRDEDGRPVQLNDVDRYGELAAERAEMPTIAAQATLLPLADLVAHEDIDNTDLEQITPAVGRMFLGPKAEMGNEELDFVQSLGLPDHWRQVLSQPDDPQSLINETSDRDLARIARAAIAFAETPGGGPASWPLVYTAVVSVVQTIPVMSAVATAAGLDLTSLPEPFGHLPWSD